jgi:hypothetical protein
MKLSTLCLAAVATLLFSCGDEVSQTPSEQIRYQKPSRSLNVQVPGNNGSTGNTQSTPTVQQVPFDFGISAVLVAGAVAAVRTARKRQKDEAKA